MVVFPTQPAMPVFGVSLSEVRRPQPRADSRGKRVRIAPGRMVRKGVPSCLTQRSMRAAGPRRGFYVAREV